MSGSAAARWRGATSPACPCFARWPGGGASRAPPQRRRRAAGKPAGALLSSRRRYLPMASELKGMRIAFLTSNEGVEQVELTAPWQAVKDAGGTPELIAPEPGEVQAFHHLSKGDRFAVDRTFRDVDQTEFAAAVVPGGVVNSDFLRTVPGAITLIKRMFDAGKPAAVICHGPWLLVEAGLVSGRTLTSWPSLQTD